MEKQLNRNNMDIAKEIIINTIKKFDTEEEKVSEILFNIYPDEMNAISNLIRDMYKENYCLNEEIKHIRILLELNK